MPFSAGVFTRTNGAFTGPTIWQQDAAAGINIIDSRHDTEGQDFANGLSTCILKDGTQTVTADIPFAGFKLQQIGDYSASTDAVNAQMMQKSGANWAGTTAGTSTAYTATLSPAPAAYVDGMYIAFVPHVNCGNAPTINLNGLGVKVLTYFTGQGLFANQLLADQLHYAVYVSNQFLVLNAYRPNLTWAPTITAAGAVVSAPTINYSRYRIDAKLGWFSINANFTLSGTSSEVRFTLPFTISSTTAGTFVARTEISPVEREGYGVWNTTTIAGVRKYDQALWGAGSSFLSASGWVELA